MKYRWNVSNNKWHENEYEYGKMRATSYGIHYIELKDEATSF